MLITEYRLELVIQALRTILPLAHPADTTLRYFFKDERIGSNERELVAETVFGVLRHRMLLEHSCAQRIQLHHAAPAAWRSPHAGCSGSAATTCANSNRC